MHLLLLYKVGIAIKLATMLQASGPSKDASNRVGAGRPSLKVKLNIRLLLTTSKYYSN